MRLLSLTFVGGVQDDLVAGAATASDLEGADIPVAHHLVRLCSRGEEGCHRQWTEQG